MFAFNQEWVDRRSERWRQEKMDLNLLVICGKLREHPKLDARADDDTTVELEVVTNTMTGDVRVIHVVKVFWYGVTDDELNTTRLLRGDRVWIAGYVTGANVVAQHVERQVEPDGDE